MHISGSHTTTRELETCTFQGPGASKTPPKVHEKTPKREERMQIVSGDGKKERNFGRSGRGKGGPERAVRERGVLGRAVVRVGVTPHWPNTEIGPKH